MCKKPCKECPYRKESIPGYLGELSYRPEEFLQQLELPNLHPCHLSVNWETEDKNDLTDKPVCVGALIFMNNSLKKSRYHGILEMQKEAGKSDEVLAFSKNFIDHHSM